MIQFVLTRNEKRNGEIRSDDTVYDFVLNQQVLSTNPKGVNIPRQ